MSDGVWHGVCTRTTEGEVKDNDAVGHDQCGRTHDED